MYRATLSFTTKNYDVRKNQILEDDFTVQSEIDEYLRIGYIVEYDDTIEITENGLYDVKDYENADVDVAGGGEINLQSKTATPTTSEQVIEADEQYDGLDKVTVGAIQTETKTVKSTTVSQTVTPTTNKFISEITVSPINLESKDISISTNGTTTITPSQNYDGISDVDVTVTGILDTSDANAVAGDIAQGKTAYVNGVKLTGTASGGSGINWSAIGFGSAQTTEQPLLEGLYAMASSIYNDWDVDNSSIINAIELATNQDPRALLIFPGVTMSDNNYNKDCSGAFRDCTNLLEIGELDFTLENTTADMFIDCFNLRYVPVLDTSLVTDMAGMFYNCISLTTACLDNIATMCINAVNVSNKSISGLFEGVSWGDYRFNYLAQNYWVDLTNAGWYF